MEQIGSPPPRWFRRIRDDAVGTVPRLLILMLAALAAIGLIWLTRHGPPFREVSDGAILEIYTLEALKGKLLLGPYSRFGWHHPGPLYFYLEAPWYWLSGRHTAGMQAGALAINLAALATVAWAAARRARTLTGMALCAGIVWYVWRTGDLIVSPWNPHVIVLPLLAFIVLAAAFASTGRRALLLWLVVTGSFLAQTHIAMVPPVALLMLVAAAVRRDTVRAAWPAATGLAVLVWLPPLVEQLTRRPGNITRIVTFFTGASSDGQTFMAAAAAWSAALTSAFRRDFVIALGFDLRPIEATWPLTWSAVQMALLIAAGLRARRRSDAFAAWLAVMCGLTSAIALLATSRIRGQIVDHEVFWISALGVMNASAIVGIMDWQRGRAPVPATAVAVVSVALAAAMGFGGMRRVLERQRTTDDHAVDVLATSIERYISDGRVRRPLIHIEQHIWPIAAGALLLLHKNDVSFAVDDRWTTMFGEAFKANGREDAHVTVTGSARLPRIVANP